MKIEPFLLERMQSLWENRVEINLTESGIHPFTIQQLFSREQIDALLNRPIGYGYTNGLPELREKISALYKNISEKNILVTNGSAEANFIAAWSLLEEGDEAVIMLPNYMQLWGTMRSLKVKLTPFYLHQELNWQPDIEEVKKIVNSRTKIIFLCNPNNPTGSVLTEENMDELISIAREHDVWIYTDEIYRGAELDGTETGSFLDRYEKSIVCGGLSKAYGLPGLRVGWLAGPAAFIESAWGYHDYTSIAAGILSNILASYALAPEKRVEILQRNRKILQKNIHIVGQWIQENGQILSYIPPRAGGMAFINYSINIPSTELYRNIRDRKSVLIVPGDCFGYERYIRVGFGGESGQLRKGLDKVTEVFNLR